MRLFNTMTRSVEAFVVRDNRVSMYVCGITPYDVTHLGHAFTYQTFDVLRRRLEAAGVSVQHVQNVTDVDDDIIRKARELGTTPAELTEANVAWFNRDMRALDILPPRAYPRATEEIDGMRALIAGLLSAGRAYAAGGDVYFDVSQFPAYGRLSRFGREQMLAENQRQQMRAGPHDPLDFLLWQAEKPGEPAWDAPWGRGRPGWHIECSAMALHHAGATVDIHGGGGDLVFPHHECEIAQSESATGQHPFVRTWMHVGMLQYQGAKMSKSLGNLVLVKDLLADHSADAIRLSLLGMHYRESREWTMDLLQVADAQAEHLAAAVAGSSPGRERLDAGPFIARFEAALDDDLDTPAAVRSLLDLASCITTETSRRIDGAQQALRLAAGQLGLGLTQMG